MAIPREAGRITYSTNIRSMKRIPINDVQKALIAGSLLGDACLHDNWSKTNYRLQVRHSKDQEAYVDWKYKILQDFVLTPPQWYGKTNSVWFRTISHPNLSELYQMFYRDGKKIIPSHIDMWIKNPLVVAVWFMDDGNAVMRNGILRGYHLNSQSFSKAENVQLAGILEDTYGIECTVERNHSYHRLAIWRKTSRKRFADIVRPHILPSMKYKLVA